MAILIVISAYFFALETTIHSWLGIVIVLTTTYCYMNIALRMPPPKPPAPPVLEKAHLLEDGDAGAQSEGDTAPEGRPSK